MPDELKRVPARFYRNEQGTEPVRDFCVREEQMILLHGFSKKTQKTPQADLDLAKKRMKEATS